LVAAAGHLGLVSGKLDAAKESAGKAGRLLGLLVALGRGADTLETDLKDDKAAPYPFPP
jgi:hypothetical protein